MEFLNILKSNDNFYIKDNFVLNKNNKEFSYNLYDGYVDALNGGGLYRTSVQLDFYQTGARLIKCQSGTKLIEFFDNNGNLVAKTFCDRFHNKDRIIIYPIEKGLLLTNIVNDLSEFQILNLNGEILARSFYIDDLKDYLSASNKNEQTRD